MNCPVCTGSALVMTDRQGVEIDYCPQCRGIWLDRGELDKLIERSAVATARTPPVADPPRMADPRLDPRLQPGYRRSDDHDDHDHHDDDHYGRPRKKKGFLGDLFDF